MPCLMPIRVNPIKNSLTCKYRLHKAMTSPKKSRIRSETHGDSGDCRGSTNSMVQSIRIPIIRPPWKPSIKRPTYCTRRVMRPNRIPEK